MEYCAIFGVPRSGTSWLGQLINSSPVVAYRFQPLFSYSHKESINESSTEKDIIKFHQELLKTVDEFVLQERNISGKENPKFAKTKISHLVWKEVRYLNVIPNLICNSKTKVIGIVRNPISVLSSWIQAPKEFDAQWDIVLEWRKALKKNQGNNFEYYGFDKWAEAVRQFHFYEKNNPNKFRVIVYEDLVKDTEKEIKILFEFLNLTFTDSTKRFIEMSQSIQDDDPYGIFKIKKSHKLAPAGIPQSIINSIQHEVQSDLILKKYVRDIF